jgi:adenine phosphoribosyltransferase
MNHDYLKNYIREVKDFPKPGIDFKDINDIFIRHLFQASISLLRQFPINSYNAIVGIDARGFILASAMATISHTPFIPIRKAGKLPPPVIQKTYNSEYDTVTLEMTPVSAQHKYQVLVVDDVLATGGTLRTAGDLCTEAGYEVAGFGCVVDLTHLNQFEWRGFKCKTLVKY